MMTMLSIEQVSDLMLDHIEALVEERRPINHVDYWNARFDISDQEVNEWIRGELVKVLLYTIDRGRPASRMELFYTSMLNGLYLGMVFGSQFDNVVEDLENVI